MSSFQIKLWGENKEMNKQKQNPNKEKNEPQLSL